MTTIFIPHNVPSSKNSKVWTGKFLVWSKSAQKYRKDTKPFWEEYKERFREVLEKKRKPYKVYFKFVRGSKHKFDYVNPLQTTLDIMVEHEWLDDDNADEILPVFERYEYDKEKPGVYITVK